MNKQILVTGAGRGLGHSIAKKHLKLGDLVYALEYEPTPELEALADAEPRLSIYLSDIGDTQSVRGACRDLLATGRPIDILYNVAGIYSFDEKTGLEGIDLDAGLKMFNVNALGALRVCQAVWPLLQQGSCVVSISSEAGSIGACRRAEEYTYCMSKTALNMGTRLMANELWGRGVRFMNLHPGWLRTRMGGEGAAKASFSVSPDESAHDIVSIALDIDNIPAHQMFMVHTGELLPW